MNDTMKGSLHMKFVVSTGRCLRQIVYHFRTIVQLSIHVSIFHTVDEKKLCSFYISTMTL